MQAHLVTLGRWVAGLTWDQIPEATRRAARYQLLDMIAAAHAATRSPESALIGEAVAAFAAPGRSTVIPTGDKYGPADAALANAAYSMAQDFDDIVWMGHTCHSAVFASLAVAEHEGAQSKGLIVALVAANEIGGRLGASSLLGPLNGQMWTFIHLASAAAATARLLGLDADRTCHALAIALAQPNFALQPGFLLPTSKLLAAATPTAAGIQAAYFARAGMTGHPGILEDQRGFWSRFSFLPLPAMLGQLGEFWVTQTLAVKTYPGCHYFQTAFTAIDRLRARWPDLTPDDVVSVRIDTTRLACEATRFAAEYVAEGGLTAVAVNFDLALSAALLLHAGRLSPTELEAAYLHASEGPLRELASRVTVHHDAALTVRVIASTRRVKLGRAALGEVRARDVLRLVRRYRDEYRSTLVSAADTLQFARALAVQLRRPAADVEVGVSAIPLAFPSRVTLERRSGARAVEEVDVPVGSFCSPGGAGEIEAKFVRETSSSLGEARARAALAAGLALEAHPLGHFIASVRARRRATPPAS